MMISSEKIEGYNKLVDKVRYYDKEKLKKISLVASPESEEINYWAYWEGGRTHLDADILLVGQDWGSIDYSEPIAERIKHQSLDQKVFCYMDGNNNKTNRNICELMKSIYPDMDLEKDKNTYTKLFFANFVPWYRCPGEKISGGYKKEWYEPSTEIFKDLVDIINPKTIMCLGKRIYENVCSSLDEPKVRHKGKYSDFVAQGNGTVKCKNGYTHIVPLVHPGTFGTKSRPIDFQKKDWERVKRYID